MAICARTAVVLLLVTALLLEASGRPVQDHSGPPCADSMLLEDGPWPVFQEIGSVDMSSGHTVSVDIYYPGYERRLDRIQRDQAAPFPVIIFSPGFGAPASNYESYLTAWASWGFVVAGVSWEYEEDRDRDVAYRDHGTVLQLLDQMASDWRSYFYNVPDTSVCGAVGHSRGGRAAFMSSSTESRIVAVSAWMPTLDNASEVGSSSFKLLFGGSDDEVAPPDVWQTPLYESSEEPIAYVELTGGDHSTDVDIHPTMSLDFFKLHLKDDRSVGGGLYGEDIKARAEGGEFRLRIKMDGTEYDSAPPPPENPSGSGGDGDGRGLGALTLVVVIVGGAAIILSRHPRMKRFFTRSRGSEDFDAEDNL